MVENAPQTAEAVFSATYIYELKDYIAFAKRLEKQNRLKKLSENWFVFFYIGTSLGLLTVAAFLQKLRFLSSENFDFFSAFVGWMVLFFAVILAGATSRKTSYKEYYEASKLGNNEFTCSLFADGFKEEMKYKNIHYPWKTIHSVEIDYDHLFIFITSMEAVIVPHRAFTSATTYYEAAEFARKRFLESRAHG